MKEIIVVNPLVNCERWDKFVWHHSEGSIFHTSNWACVIQKTYGYRTCYFVIEDSQKNIIAGFSFFLVDDWVRGRRMVSLPFTDECPLLCAGKENNVEETILKVGEEYKINSIEIRSSQTTLLNFTKFKCHCYFKLFKLDLSVGLNNLWKTFKQKSIRYPINKAQNLGVKIERFITVEGVKMFYRLNLFTRKKHGVIPQPYEFFKNIFDEIVAKGYGFILIAFYRQKPIAASIFFNYKDTLYHKFNASDINYLKYQPNHLILWEAIKWGVDNGYKVLDLGRTSPDNRGLMAFKRHWGAKEIDLPYYYWPTVKGLSAMRESSLKYRITSTLLKNSPVPVLKIAGNLLYKYFC